MARSYHVTSKDFRRLTKEEINEMSQDPNSKLNKWAEKKIVKKTVTKERKNSKKGRATEE